MKGRNLFFLSLLVLAAGLALLIWRGSIASDGVVTVGGVLFILAGVFNVLAFDYSRNHERKETGKSSRGPVSAAMSWVSSVAAVILGICMLVFKSTFTPLVPVMFGILVAFAAFYQLYVLAVGVRPAVLPAWFYFAPLLLGVGAAYLFLQNGKVDDDVIVLVTALSIMLFGAAGVLEGFFLGHQNRLMKKEGASTIAEARELRAARLAAKDTDTEHIEVAHEGTRDSETDDMSLRNVENTTQETPAEESQEERAAKVEHGAPLDD